MGATQAGGLAYAVNYGVINLEIALRAHLVTNFYPPLPVEYAPACAAALQAADEPWSVAITLPPLIDPLPKEAWYDEELTAHLVWAGDLIRACRLEAFIDIEAWEN